MNTLKSLFLREGYLLKKSRVIKVLFISIIVILLLTFILPFRNLLSELEYIEKKLPFILEERERANTDPNIRKIHNMFIERVMILISKYHPTIGISHNLYLLHSLLLGLFMVIIGATFVASEFGWKTSRPRAVYDNWLKIIFSKIGLVFITALMIALFICLISYLGNKVAWPLVLSKLETAEGFKILFPDFPANLSIISQSLVRQVISITVGGALWGLIGIFIALLTRNSFTSIVSISLFETAINFISIRKILEIPEWFFVPALRKLISHEFSYFHDYYYSLSRFYAGSPIISQTAISPMLLLMVNLVVVLVLIYFVAKRQEI